MLLLEERIENALRLQMDDAARIVALVTNGQHGVVLWKRSVEPYLPYVVHRWATHRTDGSPVLDMRGGVMFWSGGYHATLEEASEDMKERA